MANEETGWKIHRREWGGKKNTGIINTSICKVARTFYVLAE